MYPKETSVSANWVSSSQLMRVIHRLKQVFYVYKLLNVYKQIGHYYCCSHFRNEDQKVDQFSQVTD